MQSLEFYFSIHKIDEEHKISFAQLKLEGHALTWWESHMEALRLEGDRLVTKWEDFKTPHQVPILPYLVCRGPMDLLALLQEKAGEESPRLHHRV